MHLVKWGLLAAALLMGGAHAAMAQSVVLAGMLGSRALVIFDVDGVVSSGSMPYVLLGNSFLTRFQMTRTNDQMVLLKRY